MSYLVYIGEKECNVGKIGYATLLIKSYLCTQN